MTVDDVTACLVTRGNVPEGIRRIRNSLIFPHVVVWDNSERDVNARTAGRYLATEEVKTPLVWFQDDDVILSTYAQQHLLDMWRPGILVTNTAAGHKRPEGLDWIGFGSVCERDLHVEAHRLWGDAYPTKDRWWKLVGCDIAFSVLTPSLNVDVGRDIQPYAFGQDRVYTRPGYEKAKLRLYNQARALL